MNGPLRSEPGPIVVVGAHVQSLFMHVERVPSPGETVLGWGFDEPVDGGKATNQAVAAARLSAPVVLVSVVGRDRYGDAAVDLLRRENVETRWLRRRQGRTDVGFVMLAPDGIPAITTSTDLNRSFDRVTVERARDAFVGASVVVCQLEAPDEVAVTAFRLGREQGARTILNPAPARPLAPALLDLTDVLVPNEHEARGLLVRPVSTAELATTLREELGLPAVIVTAGERGAWSATVDGSVHHPAPVVEAIDSTGAGDAFVGGLAVQLRSRKDLRAGVDAAVELASRAVTRMGTIPSFPSHTELSVTSTNDLTSVGVDGRDPS